MSRSVVPRWSLALPALVALTLLLPSAAALPAFSPPNPNNPPQSWAYGAAWGATSDTTGTATSGVTSYSYELESHAYLNYNLILNQTNYTSTSFGIDVQRTLGAALYIEGCSPNCQSAVATINITATGWEVDTGIANFTTANQILVNGTQMLPSIALENEHVFVNANLSGQANWQVQGAGGKITSSGNAYLAEAVQAAASVSFTPALGLLPQNVTVGMSWNSSAAFLASGAYDKSCHGYDSALGEGSCTASGALSGGGTVQLSGSDLGFGVTARGVKYPLHYLDLTFTAGLANTYQFDVLDGVLLVPHATNLFSPTASTSATGTTSTAGISTSQVDVYPHDRRTVFAASEAAFSTSASTGNLASGLTELAPSGTASAPAALTPAQSASIQAAPESTAAAIQDNNCLLYGLGCASPTVSPTGSHLGGLLLVLGLGAVVVLVVALVARRSRMPKEPAPSTSPYAASAGPGALGATVPRTPNGPATPPKGSSQDPLGNLW